MTDAQELAIVGAGKIADIAVDIVTEADAFNVEKFVVDDQYLEEARLAHGHSTVEGWSEFVAQSPRLAFVAIGYAEHNGVRLRKIDELQALGFSLVNLISTQAFISPTAALGTNILCDRGAVIQAGSTVGDGVSLFGGAVVGHHASLDRGAWISSGAVVGGHCSVGERTFIGLGGLLAHGSRLGPRAFLGMGVSVSGRFGDDVAFVRKPDEPLDTPASTITRVLNY